MRVKVCRLENKRTFSSNVRKPLATFIVDFILFVLIVSKCESWVPFRDSGVSNRSSCTAVDTNRRDDSAGILFHHLCKWALLSKSPFYDILNNTFWFKNVCLSSVKCYGTLKHFLIFVENSINIIISPTAFSTTYIIITSLAKQSLSCSQ